MGSDAKFMKRNKRGITGVLMLLSLVGGSAITFFMVLTDQDTPYASLRSALNDIIPMIFFLSAAIFVLSKGMEYIVKGISNGGR